MIEWLTLRQTNWFLNPACTCTHEVKAHFRTGFINTVAWNNTKHCKIVRNNTEHWMVTLALFYLLCPSHALFPYVSMLWLRHHWNYLYHVHCVAIPINTCTVVFKRRSIFGSVLNILLLIAKSHPESIANTLQYWSKWERRVGLHILCYHNLGNNRHWEA